MSNEIIKTLNYFGKEITFKTGKLAPRAETSILAQVGETVVFTTVSVSKEDSSLDYFPLSIEYIEKFYASGIISGSRFLKRERRPSDEAVLKARQIDHSIRSLFPKGYKKEVSVIVQVLAYDEVNSPETLAVVSASMALMNSSIPFNGPSASVMIGIKDGEFILNPSVEMMEELEGEFVVSARDGRILNIEGQGHEIPEDKMGELLDFAVEKCQPLLDIQVEFQKEVGKEKQAFEELPVPEELIKEIDEKYHSRIEEGLYDAENRGDIYIAIKNVYLEEKQSEESESDAYSGGQVMEAIDYIARKIMRKGVLEEEKRTSGRKLDEVRELEVEVGVLPRVHGSAIFRRGKTQVLSITTLGSTRLAQMSEGLDGEEEKSFMHHYNGPNYSFGQAGRFSYYPGRREIGHGNIGEGALRMVMPSLEEFPYTTRVVSEVLSQMGSSSMASTCGASLALMDAGVPIKKAVGGISVGLVTEDGNIDNYKLLTDMEDVEDFYGDMDFKVTGTDAGVTSIQLDNKLMGVPVAVLKVAFGEAKKARGTVLAAMNAVIAAPRPELSKYAPKVQSIKINPELIGELIGPGGKNIKAILEGAGDGVDIDIQDDGTVNITATNSDGMNYALKEINSITEEPEIGKEYDATVAKVVEFGIFVDVTRSITGLVHVSEMSNEFVKDPSKLFKEGDKVRVKLIGLKDGKQSFSIKQVGK